MSSGPTHRLAQAEEVYFWPDEIVMDEATKRLVKGRWKEYGLD